jgi:uncharacterized protein (TIGR02996 family)
MTDHHHAFLAAIAANPDDPTPRLIYADWLEERGDPACAIIRWAHANGKRPRLTTYDAGQWYRGEGSSLTDPESDIPVEIFDCLSMGEFQAGTLQNYREYDMAREAWLDFIAAARRAGWTPDWPDASQGETSPFITNRETKE